MNRSYVKQLFVLSGIATITVLLKPSVATAHLVTTGMGPVYDGIGHLLLTPEDLVPVLALAIYAGLRGTAAGRMIMFLLPLAWFIGGIVGLTIDSIPSYPLPVLSFLVLGGLVASDLRLPLVAVTALASMFGFGHGLLNGAALAEGAGVHGLIGIVIIMFVCLAIVSAFVVSLEQSWTRIAARVAGSWVFASGVLMLGWLVRQGA